MGGLIGTATSTKNGLATVDMVKKQGNAISFMNSQYVKITKLLGTYNYSVVEITVWQLASWSTEQPIKILMVLSSEDSMQGIKNVLVCGNKSSVHLYRDSDNNIYIKHAFLYSARVYVSIIGSNELIVEIASPAEELTEIVIG